MATAKRFEDLRVWQNARVLVVEVYRAFGRGTAGWRDLGFRDQIQRASLSIMNNIAEGFERGSDADFARFLHVAKGSCGEVRSMLYAAEDLRYLCASEAEGTRTIESGLSPASTPDFSKGENPARSARTCAASSSNSAGTPPGPARPQQTAASRSAPDSPGRWSRR